MRTLSRTCLAAATAVALITPLAGVAAPAAGIAPRTIAETPARQITYQEWDTQTQLANGRFAGTAAVRGALRLTDPVGTRRYVDPHPHGYRAKRYDFGRWVSPWQRPGYAFEELVPSWDASTPRDSWVQIEVRGRSEAGRRSKWYTMARWAAGDRRFHRTSPGSQADDLAQVDVDTLRTRYSMGFTAWQMRVTLNRKVGTRARPSVDTVGAMTSLLPDTGKVATSRPGVARGLKVELPGFSQMIHEGHYPEYDAGGEAWCSPTSVSMVLGGLDRLPSEQEYAWVPAGHPDRWVDHAARSHYDYGYDGAGNWSFSAAYAATHADSAFVTRLRSLREAERFVAAGIPLVASVRFRAGELTGSPISSTNGHLMVIVGFTESGDVVVNDPAAPHNGSVVRTYKRGEFENAWIPKSGGLVYVVRNDDQPLPKTRTKNW
ncbi:MAG TPA: C39 family peptidase [Nocardioidaceae bacterium]|nr:C39 family peptidase [Nocardioidaceae bacterium]